MKRLTLRLTESLHTALKELSVQEHRSLHGEILYLLKQGVEAKAEQSQNGHHAKEEEEIDAQ